MKKVWVLYRQGHAGMEAAPVRAYADEERAHEDLALLTELSVGQWSVADLPLFASAGRAAAPATSAPAPVATPAASAPANDAPAAAAVTPAPAAPRAPSVPRLNAMQAAALELLAADGHAEESMHGDEPVVVMPAEGGGLISLPADDWSTLKVNGLVSHGRITASGRAHLDRIGEQRALSAAQ